MQKVGDGGELYTSRGLPSRSSGDEITRQGTRAGRKPKRWEGERGRE